jgi:putative flippase GtrA
MTVAAAVSSLPSFVRFGLVGVVGFAVDGGLLQLLVSAFDWGPIAARAVSFPCAVLATWALNRIVTFEDRGGSLARSLLRYVVVSLGGATANFAVYSALVLGSAHMAAVPIIPFAVASCVGLVFNYLGAKHFAFKG